MLSKKIMVMVITQDGGDVQCNGGDEEQDCRDVVNDENDNDDDDDGGSDDTDDNGGCSGDNADDDGGCSGDNDDDDGGCSGDNDDDDGGGVTGSATVSQTRWLKIGVVEIWHSQRPLSEICKHIIFFIFFPTTFYFVYMFNICI